MFLNNNKYKEFYFGSLISEIYKAKAINKEDLDVANNKSTSINYITRTGENNWCEMLADIVWISENYIEKWNAITIWDTTATCFYQEKQFISWDHMVVIRADWLNKYTWLYIVTLLNKEQYKYSYGRAFVKDNIKNTVLKLPVNEDWNPDRKFMENYIKSLHYKPITTKNKPWKIGLKNKKRKEFNLYPTYFDVIAWKYHYSDEYEAWKTPYISASNENNWIQQLISLEPDFQWNCIVTWKVWCTAFYQKQPFCATSDVNIFLPKFQMTENIWLFITTIINYSENYKWWYWRQCRVWNSKKLKIKLPIDDNWNPDRKFMENYIKNLPYWDRI